MGSVPIYAYLRAFKSHRRSSAAKKRWGFNGFRINASAFICGQEVFVCSSAVSRIYGVSPIGMDEKHVKCLGARALHPGRSSRHSRHREPARFRTLGQKPLHFPRGHVTFDHVAFHHGRVAATQRIRHAVLRAISLGIVDVFRLHTEAVCSQILNPRAAAASGWALIDGELGRVRIFGRAGRSEEQHV